MEEEGHIDGAGRLDLDVRMTDVRAARLLAILPEDAFLLRNKFLRGHDGGDWVLKDKFDPVHVEGKKGWAVLEIAPDKKPGVLTGIGKVFYQNAYPITAAVYSLYPIRDPDPTDLAALRHGDLNCVAQRVQEYFQGALRGEGLTSARRQKIQEWEERAHETGAIVDDVAGLERILKRSIILRDVTGGHIYNSGKYRHSRWKTVELICHNGRAWSK